MRWRAEARGVPARGVALLVALVILALVMLLSLAGLRGSTLELRLAASDELRIDAFEQAQSLVEAALATPANTPLLAPGSLICARASAACAEARVTLAPRFAAGLDDGSANVVVRRLPPERARPPVGAGFSAAHFAAAQLRVEASYDRAATGHGSARVAEGVSLLLPSGSDVFTTR